MSKQSEELNDSDCIIQEPEISCITINTTFEETLTAQQQTKLDDGAAAADEKDIEDGEIDEEDIEETAVICKLMFNKTNFDKYGDVIVDAIKEKFLNEEPIEVLRSNETDSVTLLIKTASNYGQLEDIPMPSAKPGNASIETETSETFDKEESPDFTGLSELFTIDTEPAEKLDSVKVPSYKRAIKDALLDDEAMQLKRQKMELDSLKKVKSQTCFNCGEKDHSIKDCPKPHNPKRIKQARKSVYKTERYHVDVEQRFAHLKPGVVSDKLREAMGLRKGELPFFFYRMRVLGYPPGWLEDSKVEHSGITLFNSDGTKILNSDEDEGEIETTNHKYNLAKIIEFPGFNCDPGQNFFDDYKFHNVPPLDKRNMKTEFIKGLGDNVVKAYKRKKLKEFPNNAGQDDNLNAECINEVADMEIEDENATQNQNIEFIRPPPPSEPPADESNAPPPPPPSTPPKSPCHDSPESPSLAELEAKQKLLLQELQGNNTSVIEIEDSLIDEIIELDDTFEAANEVYLQDDAENTKTSPIATHNDTSSTATESQDKSASSSQDSNAASVAIKESIMGTPVLKFSPYDNLPKGENFKVGVSDVINFENLPDSTGKYEQMKVVIKKVRTVITKLHNED